MNVYEAEKLASSSLSGYTQRHLEAAAANIKRYLAPLRLFCSAHE